MKKLAIMAILATAAVAASATEVSVSGERDSTQNGVSGYTVAITQPVTAVKGLTATAQFETTAGAAGTTVDQYSAGVAYNVATIGPVTLSALGDVGYLNVQAAGARGTYVSFGAQAVAPVSLVKGLSATASVSRQLGTSAVNAEDHTEATVGVSYVVTPAITATLSETVYDNTPGNKAAFGVSYAF